MKRSEVNPLPQFFDKYISLVKDIELLDALDTLSPVNVFADIESLEALGDKVYASGKWTIREIVQHCTDTERIMAYRALRFARNDKTPLPGFEENSYAQNAPTSERTLEDLLEEYEIVRMGTQALFKNFNQETLNRAGMGGGLSQEPISVAALGFMVVGHAIHHCHVIEERYFPLLKAQNAKKSALQ